MTSYAATDVTNAQAEAMAATREAAARRARLAPFAQLSCREAAVLVEMMEGLSADEIAAKHFVSTSTVRTQIRGILKKLGVSSQLAAVARAYQAGWQLD